MDSRASILLLIASYHKLASTEDKAFVRSFGSSMLYILKSSLKSFIVLALLFLLGSGSTSFSWVWILIEGRLLQLLPSIVRLFKPQLFLDLKGNLS